MVYQNMNDDPNNYIASLDLTGPDAFWYASVNQPVDESRYTHGSIPNLGRVVYIGLRDEKDGEYTMWDSARLTFDDGSIREISRDAYLFHTQDGQDLYLLRVYAYRYGKVIK